MLITRRLSGYLAFARTPIWLQLCKRTYYDGYEVEIIARKQGVVAADEFTLKQFKAIKAMATEMKAKAREEEQELYQDIIEACNLNIVDLTHDDTDE